MVQLRAAVVLVGGLAAIGLEAALRMGVARPEEEILEEEREPGTQVADRRVAVTVGGVGVLAPEVLGRAILVQVAVQPAPDRAALWTRLNAGRTGWSQKHMAPPLCSEAAAGETRNGIMRLTGSRRGEIRGAEDQA